MKRTPFFIISMRQYLVLATGILLATLLACSKDSLIPSSKLSNRTFTPPDEWHGMLWFEDFDHLDEYYDYLNTLANDSDDVDSTLALAEASLGLDYESLRSTVYKDSLIDREPAYEDWILDDVRTSILNSYREVRIDDSIYVNYSKNHYFCFPKDSATYMSNFRNAPKGGFSDSIPWTLVTPSVNMISASSYLTHAIPTTEIDPDPPVIIRSPPYYIDYAENPTMCNPLQKRFEFQVVDYDLFSGEAHPAADWIIDFNDGTIPNTGFSRHLSVTHTFPNFGTFTISVHAETAYLDDNNVSHDVILDQDFEITIQASCGILRAYNDEGEVECTTNDDIKIERRFWYNNDIFGQGFGARTTHLRKNNNNNWHKRDADVIEAHYEGLVRHLDCELDDVISETEHKTNAKTARVSKNIDGRCNPESGTSGHHRCKSVIDGEITYRHLSEHTNGDVTVNREFDACQ